MSVRLFPLAALAPLALLLGLAACGGGAVPAAELEKTVSSELRAKTGVAPKAVSCPTDGLEAEVGATTTCVMTTPNGDRFDVELTATKVSGSDVNFGFKVADQRK